MAQRGEATSGASAWHTCCLALGMRSPNRRAPIGPTIRRIIALALAPVGCGGGISPQPSHVEQNAGADASQPATSDARGDATEDLSLVAHTGPIPADSMSDAMGDARCLPGPCGFGCASACDPSPFEDGGTGTCAPRWIQGDGCLGGEVLFACGLPNPGAVPGLWCATYCMGSMTLNGCRVVVDGGNQYFAPSAWTVDAGGGPTVVRCYNDCTGRRPRTLVDEPSCAAESIGGALALAAYLEAASVQAFLELAEQLEAHGAPADLIRRIRRAGSDEVRHADIMGRLARARGGTVKEPRVVRSERGALLDIALHNAVEGCVRETWGAACAVLQSLRAADREVRAAMRVIARDEVAHAGLSWDIADWIATRLTREQRAEVDRERSRAISLLEGELDASVPCAWYAALGLPSREEAAAIVRRMRAEVWSAAA
jgi:hypothetical protein